MHIEEFFLQHAYFTLLIFGNIEKVIGEGKNMLDCAKGQKSE